MGQSLDATPEESGGPGQAGFCGLGRNFKRLADVARDTRVDPIEALSVAQAAHVDLWMPLVNEVRWHSHSFLHSGHMLSNERVPTAPETPPGAMVVVVDHLEVQSMAVHRVRSSGRGSSGWGGELVPPQECTIDELVVDEEDAAKFQEIVDASEEPSAGVEFLVRCTGESEYPCGAGLTFKPLTTVVAEFASDAATLLRVAVDNGIALWISMRVGTGWYGDMSSSGPEKPMAVLACPQDLEDLARTGTARSVTHLFSGFPPNCQYGTMSAHDVMVEDISLATRDIARLRLGLTHAQQIAQAVDIARATARELTMANQRADSNLLILGALSKTLGAKLPYLKPDKHPSVHKLAKEAEQVLEAAGKTKGLGLSTLMTRIKEALRAIGETPTDEPAQPGDDEPPQA